MVCQWICCSRKIWSAGNIKISSSVCWIAQNNWGFFSLLFGYLLKNKVNNFVYTSIGGAKSFELHLITNAGRKSLKTSSFQIRDSRRQIKFNWCEQIVCECACVVSIACICILQWVLSLWLFFSCFWLENWCHCLQSSENAFSGKKAKLSIRVKIDLFFCCEPRNLYSRHPELIHPKSKFFFLFNLSAAHTKLSAT